MLNLEFTTKIALCPTDEIPSVIESPFSGFDILFAGSNNIPTIKEQQTRAGTLYNFELQSIFDADALDVLVKYNRRRPLAILLFDDQRNHYQLGNEDTPIRAIINPVRFTYEVNFSGILLEHPF